MQIRLLLGPAGSGKTFQCLKEIREFLSTPSEGPDLVLLAPKQSTFLLERQILGDESVAGYTRLQILSFERLAHRIFEWLGKPPPRMLEEEGRVMVLRALLTRHRDRLQLFRASARLNGFAHQLSLLLRELQRSGLNPLLLRQLAGQAPKGEGLENKLQDLAVLFELYLEWLESHHLQDVDSLLLRATERLQAALSETAASGPEDQRPPSPKRMPGLLLWVDGFAEFSPQEVEFLAALAPHCQATTITFCLEKPAGSKISWLSSWSLARDNFDRCQQRLAAVPGAAVTRQVLARDPNCGRFSHNPVLRHLEQFWAQPKAWPGSASQHKTPHRDPVTPHSNGSALDASLRVVLCADLETEVAEAAREILRFVRGGGRYRETAILVRDLDRYHDVLRRGLTRYEIPFFLDRREPVSHHPLAELTRSALRTAAFQWQSNDWFAALKTGLAPAASEEIDHLENEALAHGWNGPIWLEAIVIPGQPELTAWVCDMQKTLLPPFRSLALALAQAANQPTGPQIAAALRRLWRDLDVENTLSNWALGESSAGQRDQPASVHTTVWDQMNAWADNIEMAFATDTLALRDWLPIVEAGLAGLTVGVIPPALDQVVIGALDRLRSPNIRLGLLLGMNEGVFPAPPTMPALLTEADRNELHRWHPGLGGTLRHHLSRERHLAYIACTRPRQRLVLTAARNDLKGVSLGLSPFLSQLRQLYPELRPDESPRRPDWLDFEHANEILVPLLQAASRPALPDRPERAGAEDRVRPSAPQPWWNALAQLPALAPTLCQLRGFHETSLESRLAAPAAARLYGPVLRTSVSRLEQFAACPFKFFVHSGLRAEERKRLELDARERGSFQHDVLALFHEQLRAENLRWRDVTPAEARTRVASLAEGLLNTYREGLLRSTEETRFTARLLSESLQDFVETLVTWMRGQYRFDPVAVELPFGGSESAPAWAIPLDQGRRLELHGRIDRVDLFRQPDGQNGLCVVIDYKSSQKKLDPVLVEHGLQLQLLAYLSVVRSWPDPTRILGVQQLIPSGVFYVNLRGKYEAEPSRVDALADPALARRLAYRHSGRFDSSALPLLDARPAVAAGDQFNYRRTQTGKIHGACTDPMKPAEFTHLLDSVEQNLKSMGQAILAGAAEVAPFRKGSLTACQQCDYQSICRMDPWTQPFRVLHKPPRDH